MSAPSIKEPVKVSAARPLSTADAAASSGAKLRRAAVITVILVVIAALAGLLPRWKRRVELRERTRELAELNVSVALPAPGRAVTSLELPAEVKPLLEAPIYARTSGYVKRFLVDIGAQVKEGDLLAEIDTPELNQELAQANAQLAQAEAALALARTTAARWSQLLQMKSVSEQETAEKVADEKLKAATVDAERANVARLRDLQAFERVTAPFSGTITARGIDIGQLIAAGGTRELYRLAQTKTLRVYARVPEYAARGISPGQSAELTLAEIPGRVFPAKVVRTSGAMSSDSRTLLTELEVDNAKGEILSGAYAQVRFPDTKVEAPITVPANALLFRAEGPQVGVAGADGVVRLANVSLGRDFGPTVEILKGVGAADQVILNPPDSLMNGVKVRVHAANEAAGAGRKAGK
jgi:RND family efflux transporter MFP subunit